MTKHIPVYPLDNLSAGDEVRPNVLILSDAVTASKEPLIVPHRTNYYGIGLCIEGKASLAANLETYDISPGSLIAMSPHIIKQWLRKSVDFRSLAILFTRDYLSGEGQANPDKFPFFESVARHIVLLNKSQAQVLHTTLQFIKEKLSTPHLHNDQMITSYISGLLYEVMSLYDDYTLQLGSLQTRSQQLAAEFKKLVNQHFLLERSVGFYAGQLFITTGHLTETVREVTGRTPGEWIAEAVVLEAAVMLQQPDLTIAQIANDLHFPDQSSFGKYFKNIKGLSPAAYRRG